MDKNRRQIIILICLLTFIANYSIYTYYIVPQYQKVMAMKEKYNQKVNKLNTLQKEKNSIDGLKKNIAELRIESQKLDAMAPKDIDTPKLIYDFYNFCKLYKVNGDTVKFQLQDGSTPQGPNETTDSNKNSKNVVGANSGLKLVSLTIDLSVSGNKKNIGSMINNLNNITDRTLNVKNIVLASEETQQSSVDDNGSNENSQLNTYNSQSNEVNGSKQTASNSSKKPLNLIYTVPLTNENITRAKNIMTENTGKSYDNGVMTNYDSQNANNSGALNNTDQMSADIIFVQYIQVSNENYEKFKNYSFFDDTDKGFESFSDMFK